MTVGLHRISFCKYAPTPAKFRELCLPSLEEAGLVEVETVYQQLCRRVTDKKFTLSPPVAWIYKNIDTSMLMDSKRQDEARRIVAQWYSRAADKICKGDDFTEDDPLPIEIKVKPVAPPMTENEMFETWKQMGWTGIMRSYQQKRGTNATRGNIQAREALTEQARRCLQLSANACLQINRSNHELIKELRDEMVRLNTMGAIGSALDQMENAGLLSDKTGTG